eukprot:m.168132 g.168132  ORF g.168132 m.168132 type:complete len:751 (-) comp17207_c0_seq4:196-2448(-)
MPHTIEYSDCAKDSPRFRAAVEEHEKSLDALEAWLKKTIKDLRALIAAEQEASKCRRQLAMDFNELEVDNPAEVPMTKDEENLDKSMRRYSFMLRELEDCRESSLQSYTESAGYLEKFGKSCLEPLRTARKTFQRASDKYYSMEEKVLSMSAKKKDDNALDESERQLDEEQKTWRKDSLSYAKQLNSMQDLRRVRLSESILLFMRRVRTFHTESENIMKGFHNEIDCINEYIQNAQALHENRTTRADKLASEYEQRAIEAADSSRVRADVAESHGIKEGYLYMQRRGRVAGIGFTWQRYYFRYSREDRRLRSEGCDLIDPDGFPVDKCMQKHSDLVDRRYCFEVSFGDREFLLQARNDAERKAWMSAMGAMEPVKTIRRKKVGKKGGAAGDEDGEETPTDTIEMLNNISQWVEKNALEEQGVYRLSGQKTRILKMYTDVMKTRKFVFDGEDPANVTSLLKHYLRELPEPLLTFGLHDTFIDATKVEPPERRAEELRKAVAQLPESNRTALQILIKHLTAVASKSQVNKMGSGNLGVVFGPTIMRPRVESVESIMNVQQQNLVVEIMVDNYATVFADRSDDASSSSAAAASSGRTSVSNSVPSTPSSATAKTFGFTPSATAAATGTPVALPRTSTGSSSALGNRPPVVPKAVATSVPVVPPPTIYDNNASTPQLVPKREAPKMKVRYVALFKCAPEGEDELEFDAADILVDVVPSPDEPEWMYATRLTTGKRGLVPANYIKIEEPKVGTDA